MRHAHHVGALGTGRHPASFDTDRPRRQLNKPSAKIRYIYIVKNNSGDFNDRGTYWREGRLTLVGLAGCRRCKDEAPTGSCVLDGAVFGR